MSGSETGLMTSREGYSGSGQPQPMVRSTNSIDMCVPYTEGAVYKPLAGVSTSHGFQSPGSGPGDTSSMSQHGMISMNMMGSGEATVKRKRGWPRKYGLDGNMSLSLDSATPVVYATASAGCAFLPSGGSISPCSTKKARGRPRGSGGKRKMDALGSTGSVFTPHVVTVGAGEDVCSKIMSFSQHGPRAICILSANGTISNVTLKQPATSDSGGTISYKGQFEILSLSGSYLLMESDGQQRKSESLNVCLGCPDGRILGGGVAGALVAASPVQVIVGSFIVKKSKEAKVSYATKSTAFPPNLVSTTDATGANSPSPEAMSESSGRPASPTNYS